MASRKAGVAALKQIHKAVSAGARGLSLDDDDLFNDTEKLRLGVGNGSATSRSEG